MNTSPGQDQLDLEAGITAAFADEHTTMEVDAVISRARRHRHRNVLTAAATLVLAVATVLVGVYAVAHRSPVTPLPTTPAVAPLPTAVDAHGAPTTFLAAYQSYVASGQVTDHLTLYDASTGQRLRDVMRWDDIDARKPRLNGFSRAANGDIWLAEQAGPIYQGDVENGDPKPHSCGGRIIRIDAATGRVTTVVQVGVDATIGSPVLSPDGRELAYLSGTCTGGGFDTGVVVRDLATGRQWRLQVAQAGVYDIRWGPDDQLAMVAELREWIPPQPSTGYVITSADTDRTFQISDLRQATPGCQVRSVAFDAAGLLVLQGCPDVVHAARLTQFDTASHPLWSVTPPATPNGGVLTLANNGHTALLYTWSTAQRTNFLSIYDGPTLLRQFHYPDVPTIFDFTW